jgi:hypothetical protein
MGGDRRSRESPGGPPTEADVVGEIQQRIAEIEQRLSEAQGPHLSGDDQDRLRSDAIDALAVAAEALRAADNATWSVLRVAEAQKERAEEYKVRAEKAEADLDALQGLMGQRAKQRLAGQ